MKKFISRIVVRKSFFAFATATIFTPLAFSAGDLEVKRKDSFADRGSLVGFSMGYAIVEGRCPINGDIGVSQDSLILSCRSNKWVKIQTGLKVTVRESSRSYANNTVAQCNDDEVVVGGGGYCDISDKFGASRPYGNGWLSICMHRPWGQAWALCAKK